MNEKELHKLVFRAYPHQCMCCGARDNLEMCFIHPSLELAMEFDNMQILCEDCAVGYKLVGSVKDWRDSLTEQ